MSSFNVDFPYFLFSWPFDLYFLRGNTIKKESSKKLILTHTVFSVCVIFPGVDSFF